MANKKWNFNKITLDDMMEYIQSEAPEDKEWFKGVAFDMRKEKKSVYKKDSDGNYILKQAKDKEGNPKFNADGTPKMVKAREYVEVENSTEKPVFNILKAKRAFCARYMPEILPKESKTETAVDKLKNW